jgi:hypothetical protein
MNANDYGTLLRFFITLGLLWAFAVFLWRRHAVEKFRQDMFSLRDSLFDLADANRESEFTFGTPAYEEFRNELNGIIRFAHRISFARAMLFHNSRRVFLPQLATSRIVRRSWAIIVGIEDERLRTALSARVRAMNWKIVKFMMKTSPFCLFVAAVVIFRAVVQVILALQALRPTTQPQPCRITSPVSIRQRAQVEIKKRAAHRLRAAHEAVWVESRELSDAGNLSPC